jgi:hypothetical protein
MAALQAIAGGWPAVYFRQSKLEGGQVTLDLDSMTRDAVALAVQVQKEALAAIHCEDADWSQEASQCGH